MTESRKNIDILDNDMKKIKIRNHSRIGLKLRQSYKLIILGINVVEQKKNRHIG